MRSIFSIIMLTFLFQSKANAAEPYKAPFWLPGGHLQTIVASIFARAPEIKYRRERWELNDGDFIDVDWADAKPENKHEATHDHKKPVLVIFHGLEGNSQSPYAKSLINAALAKGWHGAVIHFRGCSGEPNRLPRSYYAGDSAEINTMLARVRAIYPDNPIFAVGYSLGGNALLKWLGEFSDKTALNISKAVAVSAPIDLQASATALDNGLNRILYTPLFLDSMRPKALAMSKRFPGLLNEKRINNAKTIHDIDNAVTSVLYGAKNAADYYRQNASKPHLKNITLPTLIINARNDPFMPAAYLPTKSDVSSAVTLGYEDEGGHVGFYTIGTGNQHGWLPNRIIEFLAEN